MRSLFNQYKRMSFAMKFGLWGSLASILGLFIALPPFQAQSQGVSTQGNQSPAFGSNSGSVIINYNNATSPAERRHVLKNAKGGAVLVVGKPTVQVASDQSEHVCMAIAGTPITLNGKPVQEFGIDMWQKVQMMEGPCKGKTGWAALENISIE
ncbi:hypothetical protein C7H85_00615 [Zobellella endophytica]|uniref:Uncharacterized protein n=1 Tax=Zobellella endophytica TaxID=2116700 RepID=A0A2P7RAW0_9GAMM|nr:hypothetical protein [Zobellella endophytica]PSJ47374.1 hypothetical protein C7H85_00615 [Zobellella endophytica]